MLPPRLRAKSLAVVSADTPEELCKLASEKLVDYDLQGLPQYCEKCGKWIQFLSEVVLVVPKPVGAEAQIQPASIVPMGR